LLVSIHAPARGATKESKSSHIYSFVSIHAPARGATIASQVPRQGQMRFNPRTRKGCDYADASEPKTIEVSIHAPARGATLFDYFDLPVHMVSIHAPARGATYGRQEADTVASVSIHAPARGATVLQLCPVEQ